MRFTSEVIVGGGRTNEPDERFATRSHFLTIMDKDGNSFENVFAQEGALPNGIPEFGTRLVASLNLKKNRKGGMTLHFEGVVPPDIAARTQKAVEDANEAAATKAPAK